MNRCVSRRSMAACARLMTANGNVTRSSFTNIVQHQPVFTPCINLSISRNFSSDPASPVHQKIDGFVKNAKVVVFMKGVPSAPQCGFSNAVVQILRMHDVNYESHNVLADEDIRQGIKDYSNWPTIPQVYFDGEFVGGCDILLQMHQSGELVEELEKIGIKSALLAAEPEKK